MRMNALQGSSLEGRLLFGTLVLVLFTITVAAVMCTLVNETVPALWFSASICLPIAVMTVRYLLSPLRRRLQSVSDGLASLGDGDFSVSIAPSGERELREVASAYNRVGELLRKERQTLYQRELLLDTVIQAATQAIVLRDDSDRVVFSNTAARRLFASGRGIDGVSFETLLRGLPEELCEAAASGRDGLFSVRLSGQEPEVWHVTNNLFRLNGREHRLLQLRPLTRELARQELDVWKKLLRTVSHELNNSLAPISSMAHSARMLLEQGRTDSLDAVLKAIGDRSAGLKDFLSAYARFAKLPQPRPEAVQWRGFVDGLARTVEFRLEGELPSGAGWMDPAQLQQVLINLIKNAHEAGGEASDVTLQIATTPEEVLIRVSDRGPGMAEAVLENALLPFYSTKSGGSGIGLTLCREIIDAHGGRLTLRNRVSGGLQVSIHLPAGGR